MAGTTSTIMNFKLIIYEMFMKWFSCKWRSLHKHPHSFYLDVCTVQVLMFNEETINLQPSNLTNHKQFYSSFDGTITFTIRAKMSFRNVPT